MELISETEMKRYYEGIQFIIVMCVRVQWAQYGGVLLVLHQADKIPSTAAKHRAVIMKSPENVATLHPRDWRINYCNIK